MGPWKGAKPQNLRTSLDKDRDKWFIKWLEKVLGLRMVE
jgi:hypothetical protein